MPTLTQPWFAVTSVHPVWGDLAQLGVDEIMNTHFLGPPRRLPFLASVPEVSYEFLLFRVHGDHRLALSRVAGHHLGDVVKLCIPIRMIGPLARLAQRLKAVIQTTQQITNRSLTDLMTLTRKLLRQSCRALAGPAQRRHGVTSACRFHERVQVGKQALIEFNQLLAARRLERARVWAVQAP